MDIKSNKTVAIVPGSFDPITNGHIFIVKEALKLYDKVILAVMINAEKRYKFSLEERKAIASAALEGINNVEVIAFDGWLYDLANKLDADAIVKGYRNDIDLEYEKKMADFNAIYAPKAKTVLIKATNDIEGISSTLARNQLDNEASLADILPPTAILKIKEILTK
ncbi:MAG: pantetheine-phosphate adenylyltransferase [Clostridia bacterium]|nr:pantetheine-phosphate adenylyltransferase [Clostridia bacterium]